MTQTELFEKPTTPQPPELVPGTLVVCKYRMPSALQPWVAPIWVGMIEEPGNNSAEWNGTNSEQYYCTQHKRARVLYPFGVMHDHRDSLIPITPEQAALSPIEKVALFLGQEARACWERVSGPGRLE
jgi:hypothetical protein